MLSFSAFDLLFRWYDILIMGSYKAYGLSSAIIPAILVVSLIILLMVKRKKIDRTITQENSFQSQPGYPENFSQSTNKSQTQGKGALSWIVYLIWGLISVSPVVRIVGLIVCNSSGCGSDTPGINTVIAIVMAAIWILIFANFILFCKKILNFPYPPLLIYIIWILIFVGGYFASSYQAQTFTQKSQQTLQDFKQREITEINSPYVKIYPDKTEYNDGQISFSLPRGFIAINGRDAGSILGESKVIGFTDKILKIRMTWEDHTKCNYREKSMCIGPTGQGLIENKNSNGVIIRNDAATGWGIYVSLDKTKFDEKNYVSFKYDGPYDQDYSAAEQNASNIIEQIKNSVKLN